MLPMQRMCPAPWFVDCILSWPAGCAALTCTCRARWRPQARRGLQSGGRGKKKGAAAKRKGKK